MRVIDKKIMSRRLAIAMLMGVRKDYLRVL